MCTTSADTTGDWLASHALRRSVPWEARGRRGYDDRHTDEHLPNHPLLQSAGRPIRTTRLDDRRDGTGLVRLVAVTADARRRGQGRALAGVVNGYARHLGIHTLPADAAPDAVGFHGEQGRRRRAWDEGDLVGIAEGCVRMAQASAP